MSQGILLSLFVAQVVTLVGLLVVARTRIKRDPRIGKPLFSRRDSQGVKPVLFAIQVGLMLVSLQARDFPTAHALVALYGAFMLTWLAPGIGDFGVGETGLYQGWVSRSFDEFDGWQLQREELRLRVGQRWISIDIPRDKYGELRTVLSRRIPERESPADGE